MDQSTRSYASEQKCIVAFGHSHMHAIGNALSEMKSESKTFFRSEVIRLWGKYNPFVELKNDREIYNPDLLKDIYSAIDMRKPDLIVTLLLGSEYFAICFPQTRRGFDIVVPGIQSSSSAAGVEIIPYDIMFDIAYQTQKPFLGLLRDVQTSTKVPVVSLLPPPPVADVSIIRNHLPESLRVQAETYFNPPSILLYKSWSISAAVTRRICADFGIDVIAPPSEARDENGFLRSEFFGDGVHANSDYSRLVTEQIAELLYNRLPEGDTDGTSL